MSSSCPLFLFFVAWRLSPLFLSTPILGCTSSHDRGANSEVGCAGGRGSNSKGSGIWKRLGGPGPARPDPAPKIARGMPSFVEECQASLHMFDLARLVRTPHVLHPLPVLSVMCPKGPSSTFVLLPPAGPNGSTHGREWSKTSRTWSWSHNV